MHAECETEQKRGGVQGRCASRTRPHQHQPRDGGHQRGVERIHLCLDRVAPDGARKREQQSGRDRDYSGVALFFELECRQRRECRRCGGEER